MTCKHVDAFFMQKTNILAHNAIVNYLTFPRSEKGFAHKASIECADCAKARTLPESEQALRPRCLLACTHCIHFSCWHPSHLDVHRKERPEHVIYICIERGELYCALCSDFVYHPVAEQSRKTAHRMYLAHFGLSSETWRPSFDELTLLPHISSVVPLSTKVGGRPTRGLVNMGNTCFLNVVIQALTHTPVLRDYLLADLHRCNNPARSRSCLACEMIRVTQEIYSPVVTPFVPSNLLYAIWLHASHLAGYEQRDAHEFLITLLTLIHGHLIGEHVPLGDSLHDQEPPSKRRLVASRLSEDSNIPSEFKPSMSRKHSGGSSHLSVCDKDLETLNERAATKHVHPTESSTSDSASSQASVSSSRDSGESCDCIVHQRCHHDTKINTSITFPADLDLAPYLHQVDGDRSAWSDRYSLYAVLNHSGQTNSGHYTAYIRSGPGSWCLCDDQKIVSVSLEHVLQTDAYVLLYHKNLLAMRT
ncbi:hypothetical protein CRM22_004470 [Opisthorchis felineus]|uniref:Ubiquitin carboxyl-terminal hydrolase n=1 Tax=Opisthorchis felineus TaxID=147828 RepID=A0A4S2LW26_OPIFE|nr:hypothetical protein CRM22_004470 [Opisthorchis felineus]